MTRLSLTRGVYAPHHRQTAHAHEELHLSLVLQGALIEEVGGGRQAGVPLSIVTKDPGVSHADAFGPAGATLLRLSFAGTLGELVGEGSPAPRWRWTHDLAAARAFLRIASRAPGPSGGVAKDDDDLVELLACLCASSPPPRGRAPRWLAMCYAQIAAGVPQLTARQLARQAGVHPVYLARALRRWYGASLRTLVRRRRLVDAATRLTLTSHPVSTVAHDAGFADEPHCCRAFRADLGITPARFRSLARAAPRVRGA